MAALLIFVALGFYYPLQRHQPLSENRQDRANFVLAKKIISLVLVIVFSALALKSLWSLATTLHPNGFFEAFYTVLIFADVLVVLISLRYNSSYRVVFRNSGLAVATVMLRLALSAPAPWSGALGLFALALTFASNRFPPSSVSRERVVEPMLRKASIGRAEGRDGVSSSTGCGQDSTPFSSCALQAVDCWSTSHGPSFAEVGAQKP